MPHPKHAAPGRGRLLIILGVAIVAILAVTGGVLLANRGGHDKPEIASPDSTPSMTASPSEPPASASESPSSAPALEDGRYFVFVKKLHGTPPDATMTFDLAYLLTGDAANQAAADHGDETPVPNDYYIVNDNPRLRTMPVSPTVQIDPIDWTNCCEPTSVPYADWAASLTHPTDALLGTQVPYWITVTDGQIVTIEEQYLP
jgi:hypothetical protein